MEPEVPVRNVPLERTVVAAHPPSGASKGREVEMWKRTMVVLGTVVALSGCGDESLTVPEVDEAGTVGFAEPISFTELQGASSSPMRIEVKLLSGSPPLVARELEVEEPAELGHHEKIESRVLEVRRGTGGATLVLELAGLEVDLGSGTRIRDEGGAGDLALDAALDRLQTALDSGRRPPVEAKRPPPSQPQGPNDPSFFATKLRINDESSNPELELNVDRDNFDFTDANSGRGTLTVLGLVIELDVAGGRTELERKAEEASGEVEFEGLVTVADPASGSVTLAGGLQIRILEGTDIETGSSGDKHLRSVTAVAKALAAGRTVEAEGEGVEETPGVLLATKVEFEIEEEVGDIPGAQEFEGQVVTVAVGARTFSLANGTVLTLGDGITFDPEGDLHSLQAMADAVAAGAFVRAEGHAVSTGPGKALVVSEMKAEIDD
jgi:hypothetical protein